MTPLLATLLLVPAAPVPKDFHSSPIGEWRYAGSDTPPSCLRDTIRVTPTHFETLDADGRPRGYSLAWRAVEGGAMIDRLPSWRVRMDGGRLWIEMGDRSFEFKRVR